MLGAFVFMSVSGIIISVIDILVQIVYDKEPYMLAMLFNDALRCAACSYWLYHTVCEIRESAPVKRKSRNKKNEKSALLVFMVFTSVGLFIGIILYLINANGYHTGIYINVLVGVIWLLVSLLLL